MRSAMVRFVLACGLFTAWIGFLIYLAAAKGHPVVVSQPQVLVSVLDVVAEIPALDEPIVVEEILYRSKGLPPVAKGDKIRVVNLQDCRRPSTSGDTPLDWTGPGTYLVTLEEVAKEDDRYVARIAVTPVSPGFPRAGVKPTPRIYPATDDVRRQYREVKP